MSTMLIQATDIYRHKVALAAAGLGPMPVATHMAFGTAGTTAGPQDTALEAEFLRLPAHNTVDGAQLSVTATLDGTQVGANVLREVGVFDNAGDLMGRRVLAPKAYEPEFETDLTLTFQY